MPRTQLLPDELDARTVRLLLLLVGIIVGVVLFAVVLTELLG